MQMKKTYRKTCRKIPIISNQTTYMFACIQSSVLFLFALLTTHFKKWQSFCVHCSLFLSGPLHQVSFLIIPIASSKWVQPRLLTQPTVTINKSFILLHCYKLSSLLSSSCNHVVFTYNQYQHYARVHIFFTFLISFCKKAIDSTRVPLILARQMIK